MKPNNTIAILAFLASHGLTAAIEPASAGTSDRVAPPVNTRHKVGDSEAATTGGKEMEGYPDFSHGTPGKRIAQPPAYLFKLLKSMLGDNDQADCQKLRRRSIDILIQKIIQYFAKYFGVDIDGLGSGGGCSANTNRGKGNGGKTYYIYTYKVDVAGVYDYNISVEDSNIICTTSSKQRLEDDQLQAMADECAATGKITSTAAH